MKKQRVDDATAGATICEMAYKYPDATNREIWQICRDRRQTPVSLFQVAGFMRGLRAEQKLINEEDAKAEAAYTGPCRHYVRTFWRSEGVQHVRCDKCGEDLTGK
jgi:hypothetical protein